MNVEQFQNLIIGSGVVREELVSVHFSCKQRTDTNCRFRVVSRGFFGVLVGFLSSDRGGTRTLDQRINMPHRLSPTIVSSIGRDHSRRAQDST